MRAISALVSFVSLASAVFASERLFNRQIPNLPDCALTCLSTTATFGNCGSTDEKCLCGNVSFLSTIASCLEKSCSGSDVQSAISAAQSLCTSVGVTLDASSILASATASASGSSASATGPSSSQSSSASASATSAASNSALGNNVKVLSGVLGAGVAAFVAL